MIYDRVIHRMKFEEIATKYKSTKSTANLVYKQYMTTGLTNRKLNSMERISVLEAKQRAADNERKILV